MKRNEKGVDKLETLRKNPAFLALAIVLFVLIIDQVVKIYIKTNFEYGESHHIVGGLLNIQFVENPGMAFGFEYGGALGKYILSIFRMIAITVIIVFLRKTLKKDEINLAFIVCLSLILAGAAGNVIDSMAYGLLFDRGGGYPGIAQWGGSYAPFLQGQVVDMIQFNVHWPEWVPKLGGKLIFSPIFNIADSAISIAVLAFLFFPKRILPQESTD